MVLSAKKKITVNSLVSILIYFIAFYSTFRNSTIYIIGDKPTIRYLLDYIYLIIILITLLLVFLIKAKSKSRLTNKIKYILPLLLWVLLQSSITSIATGENMIPLMLLTSLLMCTVILLGINTKKQLQKTILASIFGFALTSVIPLVLYPELIGRRVGTVNGINYPGSFWNMPLLSFVSVAWILIALINEQKLSINQKTIGYLIFIIGWASGFAGLSRIFVVLTISSVLFFLVTNRKFKVSFRLVLGMYILLLIINIMFPDILRSMQGRLDTLSSANISEESRLNIWREFINNKSRYFWWGSITDYRTLGPVDFYGAPHSSFLNWLVQYGIIGLLGYLYLLSGLMKEIFKTRIKNRIVFSSLLAWLIAYLTLATVNQTGFYEPSIYLGIAFVLSWNNFDNENIKHRSSSSL